MSLLPMEKMPSPSFTSAHSWLTGARHLDGGCKELGSPLQPEMGWKSGLCSQKEIKLTECCIVNEVKHQVY